MPWDYDRETAKRRDPITARGMRRIGAATRARRLRMGWSQRRLAVATGIHQTTISRFERGERCGMRWSRFATMVECLGGLDFDAGFEQTLERRLFGPHGLSPHPPVALAQIRDLEASVVIFRAHVERREQERLDRERRREAASEEGEPGRAVAERRS